MIQKGVVAGELSQGQVGDMRLQQGTYVVYINDLHVMSVPPVVHPLLFVSIH
jgi:hypothetical protein